MILPSARIFFVEKMLIFCVEDVDEKESSCQLHECKLMFFRVMWFLILTYKRPRVANKTSKNQPSPLTAVLTIAPV